MRKIVSSTFLFLLITLFTFSKKTVTLPVKETRPNIIIILADDIGFSEQKAIKLRNQFTAL